MNDQPLVIDDHGLAQGLRALHRERANLPDPPSLHQRLGTMPLERMPTRRRWRLPVPRLNLVPMLDATRFVAAALIVAVFGGALLTTTMMQPTELQEPPVAAADANIGPGADPINGLVTQQLSPGMHRVLADAAGTDLGKTWSLAVSPDGDLWLQKRNYLVRAGDPTRHLEGELDGTLALVAGSHGRSMVFNDFSDPRERTVWVNDGKAWNHPEIDDGQPDEGQPLAMTPSGALWTHDGLSAGGVERFDFAGSTRFSADDLGIAYDDSCLTHERIGGDPYRWCGYPFKSMATGASEAVWLGVSGYGGGLARFDGSTWQSVVPEGADAAFGIASLTVAEDGTLWAAVIERDLDSVPATGRIPVSRIKKTVYLARFDGGEWTLFDWPSWISINCTTVCTGGVPMWTGPDGEVWTKDPLASFDGKTWKRYEVPTLPEWTRHGLVNDLDVALDGTVLLATEHDTYCHNCDDLPKNERALFILDPDVAEPRRTEPAVIRRTR